MSLYLGTQLLAGVATNTIYNAHDLFDHKWTDHLLNDMAWLRADTFSWQDGTVYSNAYNHLVADMVGKTQADVLSETIGPHTIYYYLADDGHKICTPDQETTVQNIYENSGVAWYYILDTANQRFKLPRTMFGFTGLRDTVGKYVEAGLPNITGSFYMGKSGSTANGYGISGAFKSVAAIGQGNSAASGGNTYQFDFDASSSNQIYGNSSTVQPPATQMYLYFYVGEYSQSQAEQVATLDVQMFLNKADIDLNNLSASGIAKFTAKLDANKIQQVSTLPVSPVAGTLYLIPE